MTFIDWSDPEDMFSLLIEYVEDEQNETYADRRRYDFLSQLLVKLFELNQHFSSLSGTQKVEHLKKIIAEIDAEFEHDSVVEHLSACVEELERIKN